MYFYMATIYKGVSFIAKGDVVGASSVDIPVPLEEFGFATGVQSGEHALFDFGYHLAVLHYLRLTNQMNPDSSKKLFDHLNKVLVDQIGYFQAGGFAMYKGEPSVWYVHGNLKGFR